MIERIIEYSIRNKLVIALFVVALAGWGIYALTRLPVDAIPDITNNQVQIISIAPSLAVQEVESFITAPVEVSVANIPDIIELRSISRLGLSVVTVVFKDGVDIYWARQQLDERIRDAEESIPPGLARIELAPVSTGLGEIFQYRLAVAPGYEQKYPPMELRTLQDWIVRREMLGTPGVADINSYGGFVKQYEIAINPERLRAMEITLTDIIEALKRNNENTGSAYIDKKPTAYFIRSLGLVKSIEDIEKIVIRSNASGIPLLIGDVATVRLGNATRYGAFVVDTSEAVGGVVMMLKGANAHQVIDYVEERMKIIQKSLPEGVTIEPYLNRSDLVSRAIRTVSFNLVEGALIVIFILVILLGNIRAGLIVASVIPLSMLFAISLMNLFGVSGNLMSLGAIDFGLIVDGAVIIVESVVHRLFWGSRQPEGKNRLTQQQMDDNVLESARRMMSSATFGQVIILIVYLPIMALVGIEGKMFRPMAQVVTFALLGAAILSLTYVPAASALFLSKNTLHRPSFSDRLMQWFHRIFEPVIGFALRKKMLVSVAAVAMFIFSLFLFSRLGGEFIPQLEEGDLAAGVMTLQGGSLSNTVETVIKANKILLDNFPEIRHAVCKIGAGEIPTDPTPMETGDYIITLKPKSEWTSAKTREELVAKMEDKLVVLAGVKFEFQQPIQMRFNELMTGSRQDVAIKLYGDNLDKLAEKAAEIEKVITGVQGVEDINVEKVTGLAQVQVTFNRDRLAQYGLSVQDANHVLQAAFAGSEAGVVYDEEKRFDMVVRLDKDYRQSLDDVKNISVALPGGSLITFDQIADIVIRSGPAQVSRENTKRRITIGFNVRNRDVQGVINEVERLLDRKLTLPAGYYVEYGGQFQNLEAAKNRLAIAVPVSLLLIFLLLYFTFRSVKQSLLIFSAVPLAAIGGILALWVRGMNFSISAGVGFIALFGVAVLNGIVLIAEFNRLEKEGVTNIKERVLKGLHHRLRPVIMTAAVASFGFIPMALSSSAGAEVQKPLATVIIGGLVTATALTLVILPVFYVIFSTHSFSNMFRRKVFINPAVAFIISFTGFPLLLKAQQEKPVNMEQAVRIALDSNLSLQSSRYSVAAQKALRPAAWDIPKTSLEYQYGQINSFQKDNSFSVSQSLSFPLLYSRQSELAAAEVTKSEFELATNQLEISFSVKQVYHQLLCLEARKQLLIYQDSLYSGFFRAADLRARAGETNKLEMITARSQSLKIKNDIRQVTADIAVLKRRLQTFMNTSMAYVPSEKSPVRLAVRPVTESPDVNENPGLLMSSQQAKVAGLEKKIEHARIFPDLTFGYFSQTMKDANNGKAATGLSDRGRFQGIQAGIAVPLWFRSYSAKLKSAELSIRASQAEAASMEQSLKGKYLELLEEISGNTANLDYFEQQALPEAELIIQQSSLSYKSGEMDYLDYVLSLGRALEIKQAYLDALNRYNQSVINLDYITGKIY